MNDVKISIPRLPHAAGLELPAYATEGSAGMDLCAALEQPLTLEPGHRALIPTGIAIAVPRGHEAQVRPRSGLAIKHGLTLLNSPGTIDSDYRGEIKVIAVNLGQAAITLKFGERIAQLVIAPVARAAWEQVENLDTTLRGSGGFGHTGV